MSNHNLLSSTVKALQPRSLKYLSTSLQGLIRGKLWLQVLVGMFLGIVVGILMGPSLGWVSPADATTISDWLALPGKLFLALIQMIVIPLVFASIIRGLAATEDLEQLKKTGFRVVLYFIFTTAIAIVGWVTLQTNEESFNVKAFFRQIARWLEFPLDMTEGLLISGYGPWHLPDMPWLFIFALLVGGAGWMITVGPAELSATASSGVTSCGLP